MHILYGSLHIAALKDLTPNHTLYIQRFQYHLLEGFSHCNSTDGTLGDYGRIAVYARAQWPSRSPGCQGDEATFSTFSCS